MEQRIENISCVFVIWKYSTTHEHLRQALDIDIYIYLWSMWF